MERSRTPGAARRLLVCALGLLLPVGALLAGRPASGQGQLRAKLVSRGSGPTTETMRQMNARALRRRAAYRGQALAPHSNPRDGGKAWDRRANAGETESSPGVRGGNAVQAVGDGFAGLNNNNIQDATIKTEDATGAMGPDAFLEMVQKGVGVFDRNGQFLFLTTPDIFFSVNSNGTQFPRHGARGPRVLYDRRSGRWFACAIEGGETNPDGASHQNNILLAVSRTNDPQGVWDKYVLPVGRPDNGSHVFITEDATLGLDDNGVYIGAEYAEEEPSQGPDVLGISPILVATPKATLIAQNPSLGSVFTFDLTGFDFFHSPQAPHNLDAVGPDAPVYVLGSSNTVFANLVFFAFNWVNGAPQPATVQTIPTANYANPPDAPSKNLNGLLETDDDRLQGSMTRNGRLWTCRTVGVNANGGNTSADRAGCEWFELQTAPAGTLSAVQTGRVLDPAAQNPRFYFQPSIAANGAGQMALGFEGSSATEFVSSFTCGRLPDDPAGTVGAVALVKGGALDLPDGKSRGRFTQTSVDPLEDLTLWTLTYFAAEVNVSHTSTWIAALLAPPPTVNDTSLEIARGQTVTFNISGTGFFDPGDGFIGPFVALDGSGFIHASLTVNSSTSATVTLSAAVDAPLGPQPMFFVAGDSQVAKIGTVTTTEPAVVQLSAATFSGTEGDLVLLNVLRTGRTDNSLTVDLKITSGTGTAGTDFPSQLGNLEIGPGIANSGTNVFIPSDFLLEGDETINVEITNLQGAGVFGPTTTAVLTLHDDASKPAPTGLSAIPIGPTSVRLNWVDHCANEDGFRVERSAAGGPFFPVKDVPANTVSTTDTLATAGTAFTYRVHAFKNGPTSTDSNQVQVTVPAGAVAKITPAKLNFGKVKRPKSKTLKITIQNTSKTGTMAGFLSETGAAYTLVGGDRPFTLLPKKKLVVSVTFTPAAAGAATGSVLAQTTAANKPSTTIPLTGSGQ